MSDSDGKSHDTNENKPEKPILEQPRPQMATLLNSLKPSPSVSFSSNDQEKVRRFTISAQPSNVNIPTLDRKNSLQNSDTREGSRNNLGHDILLFVSKSTSQPVVNATHATASIKSNNSSRVASPTIEHNYQLKFSDISPSPPPVPPGMAPRSVSLNLASSAQGSGSVSALPEEPRPISVSRKNSKVQKMVVESPQGPPVPFQQYLSKEDDGKIHILLGATGSVATIKVPLIIDKLFQIYGVNKISIQLVITKCASHFLKGLKISNQVKIWRDEDEWVNFNENMSYFNVGKKKNPYDKLVLHNELRKWADIMLLAPLSANSLAKIANGLSDNLLTSIVRSWNWPTAPKTGTGTPPQVTKKPILVAPAMNTFMYTHPLTAKQLDLLSSSEYGFGIEVLKPVEKILICGDIGMGGMREWSDIVDILRRRINGIKNMEEDQIDEEEDEEYDDEEGDDDDDDEDDDEDDDDEDDDDEEDEDELDDKAKAKQGKPDDNDNNDDMIFEIKN